MEDNTSKCVKEVLEVLQKTSPVLSHEALPHASYIDLKAALQRLSSRDMVEFETLEREEVLLEPEGEQIVANGSHEARVFEALRKAVEGLTLEELENIIGDKNATKVGQSKAFKDKWITRDGKKFKTNTDSITDTTRETLQTIKDTRTFPDAEMVTKLKKRKVVRTQKVINFKIRKGNSFALVVEEQAIDYTVEDYRAWKKAKKTADEKDVSDLKPYNFRAEGTDPQAGALHPLNKVRTEFREIFLEMGFTEMPTDKFVESGFWNFDTLFVPQQHPARDLQDTFYISDPKIADFPRGEDSHDEKDYKTYWNNVKTVHQDGKYGSAGYRYPWSGDESLKLVLRTHTTAISANMLYKLASTKGLDGRPPPARYFSIDRVFRNEAVDATHLAEFHQVEGVIADYNLTLGGLMAFMETFFGEMGLTDLKFKPAYNPYTEPSMEIFAYHSGLGKLVEIGNSGMFRPEMLEAMGLPKEMKVYGWGLSLERPTMIKYGISNIRELLGHKVDIEFIKSNPAVRLDKN